MGLNCFGGSLADVKAGYKILHPDEERWVVLQPFLLHRGYRLRPRYHAEWKPSWEKRRLLRKPDFWKCEDRLSTSYPGIIDATRVSDGAKVVIKQISTARAELRLLQILNSKDLRADPRNKTVPVFDLFLAPDTDEFAYAVMPKLMETLVIPFQFVGEVFEALSQYLKTLDFLHEHRIAHMDACSGNMMMDVTKLVPTGFHMAMTKFRENDITKNIKYMSRRETGPTDYYLIDFGISQDLSTGIENENRKFLGPWGQDKTIPEWKDPLARHDPFKVDVCQLGNVFKRIVTHNEGLEVLKSLVRAMTSINPEDRPTPAHAYQQLQEIQLSLTDSDLAQRIFYKVANKTVRQRLVRGKSPPELLNCYRILFPEWWLRRPQNPTAPSAKTVTSES